MFWFGKNKDKKKKNTDDKTVDKQDSITQGGEVQSSPQETENSKPKFTEPSKIIKAENDEIERHISDTEIEAPKVIEADQEPQLSVPANQMLPEITIAPKPEIEEKNENIVLLKSETEADTQIQTPENTPAVEAKGNLPSPLEEQKPTKDTETEKSSWLKRLRAGLNKSSSKLNDGIKDIFVRKKLDDDTLQDLEDLLITSDMGVQTSAYIASKIAKDKFDKEVSTEEIKTDLAKYVAEIIEPVAKPLVVSENKPHVILMCGVNGTGKTTTIGKIANNYKNEGKKVVIAACDTFRAAAVEQLEVWSKRSNCLLIKGKEGADPASVAYEAFEKAKQENADVLMIDTAGRLQNKKNLMEQLTKIIKVIKKLDENAPHNSVIVLDATTGQNANSQVKVFGEVVNLNGIIVTKLDGTAKGGVVVSLAKQFALPIHAIGVGESIEDLKTFDAKSFANSLVGID